MNEANRRWKGRLTSKERCVAILPQSQRQGSLGALTEASYRPGQWLSGCCRGPHVPGRSCQPKDSLESNALDLHSAVCTPHSPKALLCPLHDDVMRHPSQTREDPSHVALGAAGEGSQWHVGDRRR